MAYVKNKVARARRLQFLCLARIERLRRRRPAGDLTGLSVSTPIAYLDLWRNLKSWGFETTKPERSNT
jgi:hypothetical protein